jgi:hypothetical protein
MTTLLSLLPLTIAFLLYALVVRTAARVVKKAALPWKQALIFATLAGGAGFVCALMLSLAGAPGAPVVGVLGGLAINLAIGGWYLGPRALKADGRHVDLTGGVVIAASAWFSMLVFFGGLLLIAQLLLRNSQA